MKLLYNKTCTLCKEIKSLEDFEKDKRRKNGIGSWCNICRREKNKLSAEKNKESRSEYNKIWHLKNKQRRNKEARDNYNKEKCRIAVAKWRINNPEKVKAIKHKRRMNKISNGRNDLTSIQIKDIFSATPFCKYCGCKNKLTIDHIIPLSRGGENTLSNVSVCCGPCNSSKGTKTLLEFIKFKESSGGKKWVH